MKPSKVQLQLLWKVSARGNTSNPVRPWSQSELSRMSRSIAVCVREGWIERIETSKAHKEECLRLTTKGEKMIRRYPDRRLSFQEYSQLLEDTLERLGLKDDTAGKPIEEPTQIIG
ncbi:winged helix DNA-binding protein [Alicyclobacillus ferrooxydans]|uniref:Uncharacterized protein n=1 Tax=Alicyclobacillus ferrooxydans TaxID=471514 RepID=A0A0P9CB38_9BACL|nr:winged helix DNA-binding protein [Alicyclobacillus ferrooxydans]KPV42680.1 hypothetical protein AN477_16235 [Alicyclobacillus ferrooxydans]